MATDLHSEKTVYMAMELSNKNWKLAFSTGEKIRQVNVVAGDRAGLLKAAQTAKKKLGVSAEAKVISCYEAGRDGFWLHRWLEQQGLENLVVDAASIEVNRRQRRAKTDRLDAERLVRMLMRYAGQGERSVWKVVRVPSEAEEDERRVHRERERLVAEQTAHRARVRSLLVLHGVRVKRITADTLAGCRDWQARPLPAAVREELQREYQRLALAQEQLARLERAQAQGLKDPQNETQRRGQKLRRLRSVGPVSAWTLSHEFFGWRRFHNRREVGALAGLTGSPYDSGDSVREQGISKAGNARVRHLMVELAWGWLRYQPDSALTQWFWRRFGHGSKRMRRVGIVALARKLLVALWKYVEFDELPVGAIVVSD